MCAGLRHARSCPALPSVYSVTAPCVPAVSAALKEAGDIRAYLASYIGDADSRASYDGGHGWEHTVSVVREEEGVKSAHAVQRTELLDPLVLGDPVLYSSVTSPTNRAVGVAQSYIWLKALADRLFARAALHVPGDLKLEGRLETEDGEESVSGATQPRPRAPGHAHPTCSLVRAGLSFIDALVNRPSQLSVEPKPGSGTLPAQPHTAKPSSSVKPLILRPPTMPTYLARQRCEVCSAVVMRKMAHGPHLCAGMEYYFDTCNDVRAPRVVLVVRPSRFLRPPARAQPTTACPAGARVTPTLAAVAPVLDVYRVHAHCRGGAAQADEAVRASRRLLVAHLAELPCAQLPPHYSKPVRPACHPRTPIRARGVDSILSLGRQLEGSGRRGPQRFQPEGREAAVGEGACHRDGVDDDVHVELADTAGPQSHIH